MKKKLLSLLAITALILVFTACGETSVSTVFDAQNYSKVSSEMLVSELGEPESKAPYPLNGFELTLYTYTTDSAYIEFILKDDEVVRIHYFSNDSVSFGDKDDLFLIFGITPDDSVSQTKDTGVVVEYQSINDRVGGLTIQDVSDGSFTTAYITFNWKYFE